MSVFTLDGEQVRADQPNLPAYRKCEKCGRPGFTHALEAKVLRCQNTAQRRVTITEAAVMSGTSGPSTDRLGGILARAAESLDAAYGRNELAYVLDETVDDKTQQSIRARLGRLTGESREQARARQQREKTASAEAEALKNEQFAAIKRLADKIRQQETSRIAALVDRFQRLAQQGEIILAADVRLLEEQMGREKLEEAISKAEADPDFYRRNVAEIASRQNAERGAITWEDMRRTKAAFWANQQAGRSSQQPAAEQRARREPPAPTLELGAKRRYFD